jgi:hypothetical protein
MRNDFHALRRPGRDGLRSPAGQRFMSTQRRFTRWQRKGCTEREGAPGYTYPAPGTRSGRADASGVTAPELPIVTLATSSLQTDRPNDQLVWQDNRRGSPPPGAGRRAATCTPATLRSSLPHVLILASFARLHPTLPQAPAGRRHRAERYDGKRDLHIVYAA